MTICICEIIETPQATAHLLRTTRSPGNETHTWEVRAQGNSIHEVESSQSFHPAETIVFPKGRNIQVAGGRGETHVSAMRAYLEKL